MRTVLFMLDKEFRQIFRNKSLLPMIMAMPLIQLLVMPLAADYEIKNIHLAIIDHDHSSISSKLIQKISASGYFIITHTGNSYKQAFDKIESDQADLILEIPPQFEKNLIRDKKQNLFIAANAINGVKAGLGSQYLSQIIKSYNQDLQWSWFKIAEPKTQAGIDVRSANWFNRLLRYPLFMVPGLLVTLVTMVGVYMCSLNIVKEKEIGTIEQINVTPVKKYQFILGKLIPFWLIGVVIFSIGLFIIGRVIYGIIPQGNILLLYGYLAVFLIAVLGIGLLISTYSQTQQQAMSLAFFVMMISMLMSGLFTPTESMPEWAVWISRLNPVTYFIEVMRMVVLKGSTWTDIRMHFFTTLGFAVFFNSWAILNYRKTGG